MPPLHSLAGQILALLDTTDQDYSPAELAQRFGVTSAHAVTTCSELWHQGLVARVGLPGSTRYLSRPHYPKMPPPGQPGTLVACLGVRV